MDETESRTPSVRPRHLHSFRIGQRLDIRSSSAPKVAVAEESGKIRGADDRHSGLHDLPSFTVSADAVHTLGHE